MIAGHHAAPVPIGYGQAISLEVSDPTAVVAAITKFRASPSGKKMPFDLTLSRIVAGGEPDTTHTVLLTYDNAAQIDQANELQTATRDFAKLQESLADVSERGSMTLFSVLRRNIKEGSVTSTTPVQWLYALEVTDPEAFTQAFDKIWEETANAFPGNTFFGRVLVNGPATATHFVAFQANDMATLLDGIQKTQSTAAMAEYFADAPSFRKVESESVSQAIMAVQAAN